MKSTYFESDDILQFRVSEKPIVREESQGWQTNISYAEDGSIVEIVLLDAKKEGLLPVVPQGSLSTIKIADDKATVCLISTSPIGLRWNQTK